MCVREGQGAGNNQLLQSRVTKKLDQLNIFPLKNMQGSREREAPRHAGREGKNQCVSCMCVQTDATLCIRGRALNLGSQGSDLGSMIYSLSDFTKFT